jgi:hypothetical protein
MRLKAGRAGLLDVGVHAVAGEGDAFEVVLFAELAHEVQAGAVGEADVGDEEVELLALAACRADCTLSAVRTW